MAIVINNIKNPPSFKPSGIFNFDTLASDLTNKYSTDSSQYITNSIASVISTVDSQFSIRYYEADTSLTISFSPTDTEIGEIQVNINNDFQVSSSVQCSSYTCSNIGNLITITGDFSARPISVTFDSMIAPKAATTRDTIITTFDASSTPYLIDTFSGITFAINCTLPCKECSGSGSVCTMCYSDSTIDPHIYFDGLNNNCVDICGYGFYQNTVALTCDPC